MLLRAPPAEHVAQTHAQRLKDGRECELLARQELDGPSVDRDVLRSQARDGDEEAAGQHVHGTRLHELIDGCGEESQHCTAEERAGQHPRLAPPERVRPVHVDEWAEEPLEHIRPGREAEHAKLRVGGAAGKQHGQRAIDEAKGEALQ